MNHSAARILAGNCLVWGLSSLGLAGDSYVNPRQHEVMELAASYTVPAGAILREPVTLPLPEARLWREDKNVHLTFQLPKALDGAQPHGITLSGQAGGPAFGLKKGDVSADCLKRDEVTRCKIQYQTLRLNHAAADAFLVSRLESLEVREKFQDVRDELEHQAVGIVTFRPL